MYKQFKFVEEFLDDYLMTVQLFTTDLKGKQAIKFPELFNVMVPNRKTSISVLLTMPKPLTVSITNCGKF